MQQWYQCPGCGAQIAFGAGFCNNCGMQLNWPTQQQQQQPPQHQQPPNQQYQQQYSQPQYRQEKQPMSNTKKGLIGFAVVAVIFVAILGTCIGALSGPPDETATTTYVGVGDEGLLFSESASPYVCVTEETLDKLIDASVANDEIGFNQIFTSGAVFAVAQNTKVLVIDKKLGKCKVRILEGPHYTEIGWVITELVKPIE